MTGVFLFIEQFREIEQLFCFVCISFVVEAFAELFERGLDDPIVGEGFEIRGDGRNGNAFEIAFYVLV